MSEKRTLLFLDDEPNILKALERVFFDEDYDIEIFTSGKEALAFMKDNPVQLIISDQRMPEMSGTEFCQRALELRPDAIRIILTGYADIEAAVDAINEGRIYKFMFKPWNDDELRATVLRALEYYDLNQENEQLLAELMQKNAELEEFNKSLGQKVKERTALIVKKNLELGRMNKSLEASIVSTVKVIINLAEQINPTISHHARRVASFATTLGQQIGLSQAEIQDIEIAALLHDIGKLGIPDSILDLPKSSLNEQDRQIIEQHPVLGQAAISQIEKFEGIGKIIRYHHERWDGKGGPDSISGEQIPVEARIIAACNEYDHLLNEREGRSNAFIQKYFTTNSGSLFDPNVAGAILAFIQQQSDDVEKSKLVEVMPHELQPNMILAENLQTEKGIFLLPEGQILKDSHIRSIIDIHQVDPVPGSIKVYLPALER